ncbi:tricarboxylate transport protein-like protein [Coleophoma cylindrospora]|uniref:Tricarboxylate transport protein-like protein n=1 Tax=Coleophoma cylindrospora TaxID=1849047 RepID=A0A3D8RBL9_9HELO|nr:tricarboxylate transport protein-like protein [Coleophoma cylindrospora]
MAPDSKNDEFQTPKIVSFLSGGIAGGVEASITYPLEFAKVVVQLQAKANAKHVPRNPLPVISHVVREEGFRALYKGCSALIVGSIAKDGVRFLCFDSIKEAFQDPHTGTLTPTRSILAGMVSGVVSSTFASTPTERIKTALIDDARHENRFRSPLHACRVIYGESGFLGLYRGFLGTTLRQSCATGVRMGTYNILKDYEKRKNIAQSVATNFVNGAIAGTITTLVTQPFDTVKTRAQSARGASTVEAFTSIVADGGVRGFWRGTSMRLGRTMLSAGILFTVYERIVMVLQPVFR